MVANRMPSGSRERRAAPRAAAAGPLDAPATKGDVLAVHGKLDAVMAMVEQAMAVGQPGLSLRAFAKRVGRSYSWAKKERREGRLVLRKGRVAMEEVRKFLS